MSLLYRVIGCIIFIIYVLFLKEISKGLDRKKIKKKKDEMFAEGHNCNNCIWGKIETYTGYDYIGMPYERKQYYCLLSKHLISKDYVSGEGLYGKTYCEDVIGTEKCKWERKTKLYN